MNKWKFHIGIHRGTLTSRDSENPKELGSLEECQKAAQDALRDYTRLGCYIWFCYAISPEGERITLIEGEPYY
jgi:hypothetical protein